MKQLWVSVNEPESDRRALVLAPGEGLDPGVDDLDLLHVILHDVAHERGGEVEILAGARASRQEEILFQALKTEKNN